MTPGIRGENIRGENIKDAKIYVGMKVHNRKQSFVLHSFTMHALLT